MNPNFLKVIQNHFLALLGLISLMGLAPPAMADSDLALVVEAREIAFAKTMADRNFDVFQTFISTEAIFYNGNVPLKGIEAIKEVWSRFYEGEQAPFSWHPYTVEVLASGQLGLSSGKVFSPEGDEIGRFNSIWRKEADGLWRVVFDKGS